MTKTCMHQMKVRVGESFSASSWGKADVRRHGASSPLVAGPRPTSSYSVSPVTRVLEVVATDSTPQRMSYEQDVSVIRSCDGPLGRLHRRLERWRIVPQPYGDGRFTS